MDWKSTQVAAGMGYLCFIVSGVSTGNTWMMGAWNHLKVTSLVHIVLKAGLTWDVSRSPYLLLPLCGLGFITPFWPQGNHTLFTQQLRAPRPSVLTNKAEAAGLPNGISRIASLLPFVGWSGFKVGSTWTPSLHGRHVKEFVVMFLKCLGNILVMFYPYHFELKSKRKCFSFKIDMEMAGMEGNFILGTRPEGELRPENRGGTMMRLEQIESTEQDYQTWLTLYPNLFTLLPGVFKIQPK